MPQYPARSLVQPRVWRAVSSPDYEVRSQESGLGFSNEGADGQVNFFLPPAYPGRNYAIFNAEGEAINVVATGDDHISIDQTVATSFNDGGALGSFLQLECPAAPGLWVATGATKAWTGGGGGGGLPSITGTWDGVANAVLPFIAGYNQFHITLDVTTSADISTFPQPAFLVSASLDGSDPIDDAQYGYLGSQAFSFNGNGTRIYCGTAWNDGQDPPLDPATMPIRITMDIDNIGDTDRLFVCAGGFSYIQNSEGTSDSSSFGFCQFLGSRQLFGKVQSLVLNSDADPTWQWSGSYKVQATG